MKPVNILPFFLLLLLHVVICDVTIAQEFSYCHYDTKDGLAGATVYSITQDKDGFIWFGTETGLSRFDGKNFKNYTIADGLPNNEVIGIFTDSKNRVWVNCFKNAACYYSKGKFHNPQNDTLLKKIVVDYPLVHIAENAKGDLLLGDDHTSYIIKQTGVARLTPTINNDTHRRSQAFSPVAGIGAASIDLIKVPDHIYQQLKSYPSVWPFPTISLAPNGGMSHYAYQRSPLDDTFSFFRRGDVRHHNIPLTSLSKYFQPINQNIFAIIREYNGVTLYNVESNKVASDYLTRYTVQYVFEDAEKNLWFATKGSGVFRISNGHYKNYLFHDLGVRNITEINNRIYIGTDNNGYWMIPSLNAGSFDKNTSRGPTKKNGSLKDVTSSTETAYINCAGSDFLHFDQYGGPDQHIGSIKTIQFYRDTLLVTSSHCCATMLASRKGVLDIIYSGRTTCAYYQNGTYYIGTVNRLYRFEKGKSKEFPEDLDKLFRCHISQIVESNDGTLWVSTFERGIIGFRNNRIIANIRQSDGLTSDICRCLFINGNTLWAGTDKGLNKIDIARGNAIVIGRFTESDGLSSNIINTVYTAGRYVYVGTALGMTVFDETTIPRHAMCNLRMTKIVVSGIEKNPYSDHLLLRHDDNNIRFEFSGISFLSGGELTYRYCLAGLDSKWQVSEENILSYPSLPSGKYVLQIQATNKFGDKSTMLKFPFEIRKTILEEWWFRGLIILTIVGLTGFVVRFQIKRNHFKEKEKLLTAQQLMELEQMALRAQMNPHFIFNCLNSMQQYIMNQDAKTANFYLSRFAGLVRQTLDNSSKINIPLADEIAYLKNYLELERLQLSESFEYVINVDRDIEQAKTMIPNMVLQPYVENAVKHGISQLSGNGVISISFHLRQDGSLLECIIEDNGPGIIHMQYLKTLRPHTHASHGMSITEKRINTINQLNSSVEDISISVEDRSTLIPPVPGTRVTIRFPR